MTRTRGGGSGGGRKGRGSRPDAARDQGPGKTPEEQARGPVPGGEERASGKAGIGRLPDPTPGDREHPDVARPDWPLFRDRQPGWRHAPGVVGGGERRDPGAPPDDLPESPGPEHGARQGGEGRDARDLEVTGGAGEWKNPNQGRGGGEPGRNFGNQPNVKEADELSGAVPAKDKP